MINPEPVIDPQLVPPEQGMTIDLRNNFVTVECSSGNYMDWTEGQENWLVTYNLNRCVALVAISKKRAFLFHVDLTETEAIGNASEDFCEWWERDKEAQEDSRLFVIRPQDPYDAEDARNIKRLHEAVKGTTGKNVKVADFDPALNEGSTAVEVRYDASVPGSK